MTITFSVLDGPRSDVRRPSFRNQPRPTDGAMLVVDPSAVGRDLLEPLGRILVPAARSKAGNASSMWPAGRVSPRSPERLDVGRRLQDIRSKARADKSGVSSSSSSGSSSSRTGGVQEGVAGGVAGGATGGASGGVYTEDRRPPPPNSSSTGRNGIPAGHEIDVRLDRELTSDTAQVEDDFQATTVADVYQGVG